MMYEIVSELEESGWGGGYKWEMLAVSWLLLKLGVEDIEPIMFVWFYKKFKFIYIYMCMCTHTHSLHRKKLDVCVTLSEACELSAELGENSLMFLGYKKDEKRTIIDSSTLSLIFCITMDWNTNGANPFHYGPVIKYWSRRYCCGFYLFVCFLKRVTQHQHELFLICSTGCQLSY